MSQELIAAIEAVDLMWKPSSLELITSMSLPASERHIGIITEEGQDLHWRHYE